jgi:hypothetical protein
VNAGEETAVDQAFRYGLTAARFVSLHLSSR